MAVGRDAVQFARGQIIFMSVLRIIVGLGFFGLMTYILVKVNDDKTEDYFHFALPENAKIILSGIVVSFFVLIFIDGFAGVCGAVCKSRTTFKVHLFLLLVILIADIAAAIFVSVKIEDWKNEGREKMKSSVQNHTEKEKDIIDNIQIMLDCCGADDFRDYAGSLWFMQQTPPKMQVPGTCCKGKGDDVSSYIPDNYTECSNEAQNVSSGKDKIHLHSKGCADAAWEQVSGCTVVIVGIAIGAFVLEAIEFALSVYMCRHLSEEEIKQKNDETEMKKTQNPKSDMKAHSPRE